MRRAYQSDLSDAEWKLIEPHLPVPGAPGRPRIHPLREIVDAVFYVVRGGCTWRLLVHDFPPWKTVYHYFRLWRIDGTWERLHEALRRRARVRLGRAPHPSAGIVDSQSVKTTGIGGEERGFVLQDLADALSVAPRGRRARVPSLPPPFVVVRA